jgi:hypothetical protein
LLSVLVDFWQSLEREVWLGWVEGFFWKDDGWSWGELLVCEGLLLLLGLFEDCLGVLFYALFWFEG